ncbi:MULTISPECIES: hypothetical protein [unclassified Mesorhizobium]|uniref:hypothetical protein n=1 Tax=unclassified Mesorhizobium TaxID=325217 RepID=UPI000FE74BD9|nr:MULTISPECIES: hypothetical protein [unclassified Mesorhizobium]RWB75633.1 MAG: hypothetical protein EOQ49_03890 [Mesorhizobium sp.]RWE20124.1 MAG: hypothetical protein EOS41_29260 [Mesorhizobium sp.]TGS63824.1 hypothetical protein EN844_22960 [Mesorhizobium sp. M3A.F.Ca.ET.201.01.1.1]TGT54238.1 hypothetical protein EN813_044210 [Mesorhizobium sp. M00.F.Ca.ET.170.01.1.1]
MASKRDPSARALPSDDRWPQATNQATDERLPLPARPKPHFGGFCWGINTFLWIGAGWDLPPITRSTTPADGRARRREPHGAAAFEANWPEFAAEHLELAAG